MSTAREVELEEFLSKQAGEGDDDRVNQANRRHLAHIMLVGTLLTKQTGSMLELNLMTELNF